MNLILFEPHEIARPLAGTDRRAVHLLKVLRRRAGETFDAGVIDGPRGKGTVVSVDANEVELCFKWDDPPPPRDPIILIVGLPRPQTARDILREATTLGVTALHFVRTDKGDQNYAQSTLWSSGEWRRHALAGAEQAFVTQVPAITYGTTVTALVGSLAPACQRVALDNYDAAAPLSRLHLAAPQVALAIGSERGWSAAEREILRAANFTFQHLGTRVLRTETAVIAALAIVRAKLGLM